MTAGAGAPAKPPKIVPKVGDVFTVPIDDSRMGCGQVVGRHEALSLYVAIFGETFGAGEEVDPAAVADSTPALLTHSTDALIWHGDWPIVGRVPPRDWPRPTFKLPSSGPGSPLDLVSYDFSRRRRGSPEELEDALAPTTYAPVAVENALMALLGEREWEDRFDLMRYETALRSSRLEV